MDYVILFLVVLVLTFVMHYLGFSASEEYFFLERKRAKGLFFLFFAILIFSAYLVWIQQLLGDKLIKFLI